MTEASTPATNVGGEASNVSSTEQATASSPKTEPTTPKVEEKFKIKVNNQERELSLAELKNLASKAAGADEKFQKAAQVEKKAKELLDSVKGKQLAKVLQSEGMTKAEIRQYLEDQLVPFVEEDLLSPEERQKRELENELKRYKEEEDSKKKEELTKRQQEELQRELVKLEEEFGQALNQVDLPRDPYLGKQISQVMLGAEKNGYEISALEAAEIVKEQYLRNTRETLGKFEINKLKEYLGKDILSKLREDDVKAVKDAERPFTKQTKTPAVKQDSEKPSDKKLAPEFFNKLRGIKYNN